MLDDKLKNKIYEREGELSNIHDFIYKLNNEIDVLNSKYNSYSRKRLVCKTAIRLLSFIFTCIGIVVIGGICNVNLFIMLLSCMFLITVNLVIDDFVCKILNNKYNIKEIMELIMNKKALLNKYKEKEKILINELSVIKEDYCKNKEMILFTENMNKECSCEGINHNTIPKLKMKTKKS